MHLLALLGPLTNHDNDRFPYPHTLSYFSTSDPYITSHPYLGWSLPIIYRPLYKEYKLPPSTALVYATPP